MYFPIFTALHLFVLQLFFTLKKDTHLGGPKPLLCMELTSGINDLGDGVETWHWGTSQISHPSIRSWGWQCLAHYENMHCEYTIKISGNLILYPVVTLSVKLQQYSDTYSDISLSGVKLTWGAFPNQLGNKFFFVRNLALG